MQLSSCPVDKGKRLVRLPDVHRASRRPLTILLLFTERSWSHLPFTGKLCFSRQAARAALAPPYCALLSYCLSSPVNFAREARHLVLIRCFPTRYLFLLPGIFLFFFALVELLSVPAGTSHRSHEKGQKSDRHPDAPELELELIQSRMAQKPVLRGEVGCACVAREVSVERGCMGERGCARRLGGWVGVGVKPIRASDAPRQLQRPHRMRRLPGRHRPAFYHRRRLHKRAVSRNLLQRRRDDRTVLGHDS